MTPRRTDRNTAAGNRPPGRRGIATIELVLCTPILLFLALMIFVLGQASLQKSEVAIEARYEAWRRRQPDQSPGSLRLRDLALKIEERRANDPIRMPAALVTDGGSRRAESVHSLLTGHWSDDDPEVLFFEEDAPHWEMLQRLAGGATESGNLFEVAQQILASGIGDISQFGVEVARPMNQVVRTAAEAFRPLNDVFDFLNDTLGTLNDLVGDVVDVLPDAIADEINKAIDAIEVVSDLQWLLDHTRFLLNAAEGKSEPAAVPEVPDEIQSILEALENL